MISLLVAYAHGHVIGRNNDLPWYLPADLKRFKELTTGHPVVMGRKTFDSIISRNGKPLPNRTNIVVTRDPAYKYDSVMVAHDLDEAVMIGQPEGETFIIGGAEIFRQSLVLADRIYATEIDADIDGNVHFPEFDHAVWQEISRDHHLADDKNPYNYDYVTYEKADE